MNKFSCVIFDLDGTLTRTNELIFASFNRVAEKYLDKVFSPAEIVSMFGPPEEVAVERLVGTGRTNEALVDFYEFYELHHQRLAVLHEGIRQLLDVLKTRHVRMAVFTGKGRETTRITLCKLGIGHYFDLVVTGSDVQLHKPSGEGIRKVLDTFSLPPHHVLMVGDAVSDVLAARETGVAMAAVLWDSYGKEQVLEMNVQNRFSSVDELSVWMTSRLSDNGNDVH